MNEITLNAFAKLNLALDIVGEDGEGYHLLDGVMLRIDRADRVTIAKTGGSDLRVTCSGPFAAGLSQGEDNLAARAARLFFRERNMQPCGLHISLEKNIPAQAGLAGGSADAAAVLRGLCALFDAQIPDRRLEELGRSLGADVPFCLRGGCVRAQGRGEQMEPLPLPERCRFVVAKPHAGMRTKEAFDRYDKRESEPARPDIPAMLRAVSAGDPAQIGSAMANVFESLGAPPEVAQIKAIMRESGALGAVMTGTGTAVAGLFTDEEAARRCQTALRGFPVVFFARPTA